MDRADARARDWAEIQERMLVPLYEAVYERLDVGRHTRLLGLGCGSGLALLMAAARGATVTGVDLDERRLALARERLLPEPQRGTTGCSAQAQLLCGGPERAYQHTGSLYTMVTAFEPATPRTELAPALIDAARLAGRGSPVVLAGWGPPERCATARVLRMAERLAEPGRRPGSEPARVSGRDDLEELARAAGLGLDGSGRVACPFAYPDMDSAVRGLFSTGLFDQAVAASDRTQVEKELTEALHPYRHPDGTVRMDNVFRYLIARV
ncbi:methyltransferase domain-containing protein [Streptomyces sp. RB6PN25]|uniref:Methyltransferase domain-containing protein n=1 Tax=Streptomyces humicola TaxID=2953240 RepID=A0ABT1Q5X7_9ACTN|nr:methyltransferase domain-containing protein [Streptomyces humicola]MCQ4084187.1 methyltransferase domain-containing protein [Streptomyces humicola]